MKYKSIFTLAILLLITLSCSSNATLIEHNGYILDENTNIVTNGDIEWLQWDLTAGLSIENALADYDGWTLASNVQIASLFSDFFKGKVWSSYDNGGAFGSGYNNEVTSELNFIELFGYIEHVPIGLSGSDLYTDAFYSVNALYGSDIDGTGLYREAIVNDAFAGIFNMGGNLETYGVGASAELTLAQIRPNVGFFQRGVALVRVTTVPEPNSILLFMSFLLIYFIKKLKIIF